MNVQELMNLLEKVDDKEMKVLISITKYGDYLLNADPQVEFVGRDPETVIDPPLLEELMHEDPNYQYDQALVFWKD